MELENILSFKTNKIKDLIGSTFTEDQAMLLAIKLAEQGSSFVAPNPMVGAVVLDKKNKLLGFGYHKKYGSHHAEVNALKSIKDKNKLKLSKLFVTLEPCAHFGKTPSCAQMLAKAPVSVVIYGAKDPNPLVSGKGLAILKSAGIKVKKYRGKYLDKIENINEIFFTNIIKKRSFVSLKVASSLDGQIGLKNGESQWISSEVSRNHSNYLRGCHEATLIGVQTLLIDNPKLNIRHKFFNSNTNTKTKTQSKKNQIIILDPSGKSLDFLKKSNLLKHNDPDRVFVVVDKSNSKNKKLVSKYCNIINLKDIKSSKSPSKIICLKSLCEYLNSEFDISSIFVEGGAYTISEFLNQKLGDRLYSYIAPSVIGSKYGRSWSSGFSIKKLDNKISLSSISWQVLGPDILLSGRPNF